MVSLSEGTLVTSRLHTVVYSAEVGYCVWAQTSWAREVTISTLTLLVTWPLAIALSVAWENVGILKEAAQSEEDGGVAWYGVKAGDACESDKEGLDMKMIWDWRKQKDQTLNSYVGSVWFIDTSACDGL